VVARSAFEDLSAFVALSVLIAGAATIANGTAETRTRPSEVPSTSTSTKTAGLLLIAATQSAGRGSAQWPSFKLTLGWTPAEKSRRMPRPALQLSLVEQTG
jgi:hypothetical protein